MAAWFRKKTEVVVNKPICVHDWYLIDMTTQTMYNGIEVDFEDFYTIGCVKCNERRTMIEFSYRRFKRVFTIKEGEESE